MFAIKLSTSITHRSQSSSLLFEKRDGEKKEISTAKTQKKWSIIGNVSEISSPIEIKRLIKTFYFRHILSNVSRWFAPRRKVFQRAPLGICRSIEKNLNTKLDHESFRLKFIDCLQTIYADDQNDLKVTIYDRKSLSSSKSNNQIYYFIILKFRIQKSIAVKKMLVQLKFLRTSPMYIWFMKNIVVAIPNWCPNSGRYAWILTDILQLLNIFSTRIPLSFIAILMAINFLWILVNLSFNFYLILISTIDSKRFIFKREFLKSKPRFPSFGRVDEILRSKNPMIRLKLEFDLDQIDRSTPTPKPTRTINQQLRTSLTSFEMVSRRFQSKQIKF